MNNKMKLFTFGLSIFSSILCIVLLLNNLPKYQEYVFTNRANEEQVKKYMDEVLGNQCRTDYDCMSYVFKNDFVSSNIKTISILPVADLYYTGSLEPLIKAREINTYPINDYIIHMTFNDGRKPYDFKLFYGKMSVLVEFILSCCDKNNRNYVLLDNQRRKIESLEQRYSNKDIIRVPAFLSFDNGDVHLKMKKELKDAYFLEDILNIVHIAEMRSQTKFSNQ